MSPALPPRSFGSLAPLHVSWPGSPSASGSGSVVQVHLVYSLIEMGAGKRVGGGGSEDEEEGSLPGPAQQAASQTSTSQFGTLIKEFGGPSAF